METLKPFEPLFSIHLIGDLKILDDENLEVTFTWKDMQNQLLFPIEQSLGRQHELWKQTCFEIFLRPKIGIGYFEINLSTTGAWNIYKFESYRNPQPPEEYPLGEVLSIQSEKEKIVARFKIENADLSLIEYSLCAVLVLKNGKITYWSTHHSQHKPDFHHPDNLTLERKHI